jgi:hypothetical protein
MTKPTRIITVQEFTQIKAWSKLSDAVLYKASTAKLRAFRQNLEEYNNRFEYFEFEQIDEEVRDQNLLGSWYFTNWKRITERVDAAIAERTFDEMFADVNA